MRIDRTLDDAGKRWRLEIVAHIVAQDVVQFGCVYLRIFHRFLRCLYGQLREIFVRRQHSATFNARAGGYPFVARVQELRKHVVGHLSPWNCTSCSYDFHFKPLHDSGSEPRILARQPNKRI